MSKYHIKFNSIEETFIFFLIEINIFIDEIMCVCVRVCGNLLSFLLRCGTKPYERGTQCDSNSLV